MSELKPSQFAALHGLVPAVVVVDVQHDFAAPEVIGAWCETPDDLAAVQRAVGEIVRLVDAARAAGVPVVWVELASHHDTWTVDNWLRRGDRSLGDGDARPCLEGTPGAAWYGGLEPAAGEIRVLKDSYSGFIGTDLDARLRAAGIDWLVVTGLTTECCVYSTANDAMQHDWPVVVPADACAAYGAEWHQAALKMLALNSSVVSDVAEVLGLLKEAA
jgi:nicotinamidase-related amidase